MNVTEFFWLNGLVGGALIGLAAVIMMLSIGRIAGVSSIYASLFRPKSALVWQWTFIGGILSSGLLYQWLYRPIAVEINSNIFLLIVAGLLVGFGSRLGSGCTSGHGICGISRLSPRSLVATAIFIGAGVLTILFMRIVKGDI